MVGLPRLLLLTDSLKEGEKCGDTERRGDNGEGVSHGVTSILLRSGCIVEIMCARPAAFARLDMMSWPSMWA